MSMEAIRGLTGLFKSRKAVVFLLEAAVLTYLLQRGYLSAEVYTFALTAAGGVWKVTHSHEESNKAKAQKEPMEQLLDRATTIALDLAEQQTQPPEDDDVDLDS